MKIKKIQRYDADDIIQMLQSYLEKTHSMKVERVTLLHLESDKTIHAHVTYIE